jgi:hypothetical protein
MVKHKLRYYKYNSKWRVRFRHAYWAVKDRIIFQHNMKTGLKPGYHDIDTKILHGCFHEFSRFYEQQLNGHIDWTSNPKDWNEMTRLYEWWRDRDKIRRVTAIKHPKNGSYFETVGGRNLMKITPAASQAYSLIHKQEEDWDLEDTNMLIALIKIRGILWD